MRGLLRAVNILTVKNSQSVDMVEDCVRSEALAPGADEGIQPIQRWHGKSGIDGVGSLENARTQ